MTLAEKIKAMRKQQNISQESLAKKIGVSRQAITKWETGGGVPDIENLLSISGLFGVSLDELVSNQGGSKENIEYLYESVCEYDIREEKHFDLTLGTAKKLILSGYPGEKIKVTLASHEQYHQQGIQGKSDCFCVFTHGICGRSGM